jgi:hypothetical protein
MDDFCGHGSAPAAAFDYHLPYISDRLDRRYTAIFRHAYQLGAGRKLDFEPSQPGFIDWLVYCARLANQCNCYRNLNC